MSKKTYKLNKKQQMFVNEYVTNGYNGTQAAIAAGYSPKTASAQSSRMLKNANILRLIEESQKETRKKTEIDKEYILRSYEELLKSCIEEGNPGRDGQTIKDRTNWNKALQNLSKMLGFDAPTKTEITHKGININYIIPEDNEEDE